MPPVRVHDNELNVCVLLLVNDTVPVGDTPLIVTDTAEEPPTVTDDGWSEIDSVGVVGVTLRAALPDLP
ncbi:MAG: hypothetical protein ACREBI_04360 [Nitrosotalea sp.]